MAVRLIERGRAVEGDPDVVAEDVQIAGSRKSGSGRRRAGRLGRRRDGLEGGRRNAGRCRFDTQDQPRRGPENEDRSGVGSRRRRFGSRPFRGVAGLVPLRAAEAERAENDDGEGPTDALHRSPSALDNFCRFGLRIADPLWRARCGISPQVIAV